ACGAGGGIGTLRRLLGEDQIPAAIVRSPPATELNVGRKPIDVEFERMRLAAAVKAAGLIRWERAHEGKGWEDRRRGVWEDVLQCHRAFWKYQCRNGHRAADTFSCGFPLCPICVPTRLRADFLRHEEKLPERL